MITTGRNKFILGQSGNDSQTVFLPTSGAISTASYQNGTISSALPVGTNVITIEGGAFTGALVGTVVGSTIASNSKSGDTTNNYYDAPAK